MRLISASDLERTAERPPPEFAETCIFSVRCCFAGITLELRTDVAGLPDEFVRYYADHRTDSKVDLCYYVQRAPGGYVFWSTGSPAYHWRTGELPADALMFLTDACAISALVASDPELVSIHAASIESGGTAAAILGNSTAGKTTTLLACARAGLRVYSDERALLRGNVVQPFLRRCSVRPDGRRRLLADCADDALATTLRDRSEFSLAKVFGTGVVAAPRALNAIFMLAGYAERPNVERIPPAGVLTAMTPWLDVPGSALDRIARALQIARNARCYRLVLGSPAASAEAIRETMAQVCDAAATY